MAEKDPSEEVVGESTVTGDQAARLIRTYPALFGEHGEDEDKLEKIKSGETPVTMQVMADGSRQLKVGGRTSKAKREAATDADVDQSQVVGTPALEAAGQEDLASEAKSPKPSSGSK